MKGRRLRRPSLSTREVTFSGSVQLAALTPDGRTVTYVVTEPGDPDDARVYVRDLAGGPALEIARAKRVMDAAWLPSGFHVVLSVEERDGFATWMVSRFGGPPRRFQPSGRVAVSPDGSQLALSWQNGLGFAVVQVSDGAHRIVRLTGFQWLDQLAWNPRGDRLALLTRMGGEAIIWTVNPDGRDQRRIHADKQLVWTVFWSPAGDALYFCANGAMLPSS